jgi:hypothetical protein
MLEEPGTQQALEEAEAATTPLFVYHEAGSILSFCTDNLSKLSAALGLD